MVDLIPFGYELETLEIRLHEAWPHVDLHVVYESELTQVAAFKDLGWTFTSLVQLRQGSAPPRLSQSIAP